MSKETTDILADLRDPRADGHLNSRAADEIERLRAGLMRVLQYENKCDETGRPCGDDPERCACRLEAYTWMEDRANAR